MLKTTGSFDVSRPEVENGDSAVVGFGVDGGDDNELAKKLGKLSKSLKLSKSGNSKCKNSAKSKKPSKIGNSPNFDTQKAGPSFLTPKTRAAFNRLRLTFTKAPILQHFDPEYYIWIEIDASDYAISAVLSPLASGTSLYEVVTKIDLGQWHPVAFFFRKMIPVETRYETHDGELLAIIEAFKTWHHYLKGCKHEVFVLTDHNNLRCFIDTKNLSSRQVRWAQELSRYHFRIDYCHGKVNAAADALSKFLQRSQDEDEELWAENCWILHRLQNSLTSASLAGLSLSSSSSLPSQLHQVLICGTYVLPQLRQFWQGLQKKLAQEEPYVVGSMRLRLHELEAKDKHVRKLRAEQLVKDWQYINDVLHHQGLPYVPEIIQTELISRYHNDPLAVYFRIKKTQELLFRKYYWPTLRSDVNNYVRGCNVYLALKAVRHKPYGDLQSLPILTHHWKDLSMDFVTVLLISTDWKGNSYDSILVIVDWLTKMVYYKLVKVTIDAPGLAKVIIGVVVRHHNFSDSIVTDRGSLFTSKFWSLLCYFLGIK